MKLKKKNPMANPSMPHYPRFFSVLLKNMTELLMMETVTRKIGPTEQLKKVSSI